jgi:hypothetical protein
MGDGDAITSWSPYFSHAPLGSRNLRLLRDSGTSLGKILALARAAPLLERL